MYTLIILTYFKIFLDSYNLHSDELTLECRVRGEPTPTITWTRDNELVSSEPNYKQFNQADGYCKLVIHHPSEKDNGTYICKAENYLDSDKTTHNVNFKGRDAHILQKSHGFAHRNINLPHFENQLGDHMVTKGGTIALHAELLHDVSEVQWIRDREVIQPNKDNVRAYQEHGVYTLIVPQASATESGTYVCRAMNDFGKVESVAHVHIVGPDIQGGGKCPVFLSRPENDQLIMTGDPFSFSFRVVGDPKPKCKFLIVLSLDPKNKMYISVFSSDLL